MYSLGFRLSNGASEVRIMNSLSKRLHHERNQASRSRSSMVLSLGKRSGIPFTSQFAMCTCWTR